MDPPIRWFCAIATYTHKTIRWNQRQIVGDKPKELRLDDDWPMDTNYTSKQSMASGQHSFLSMANYGYALCHLVAATGWADQADPPNHKLEPGTSSIHPTARNEDKVLHNVDHQRQFCEDENSKLCLDRGQLPRSEWSLGNWSEDGAFWTWLVANMRLQ